MQDKHCHVRAEFRNQPWARVLVGYLPRWASVKPKGIGKDTYQACLDIACVLACM